MRGTTAKRLGSVYLLSASLIFLGMASGAGEIHADVIMFGVGNSTPGDPDGEAADRLEQALSDAPGCDFSDDSEVIHDAGGQDITDGIGEALEAVGPGDLFVFYYIGHGGTSDNTSGDEDEAGDGAQTQGDEYIGVEGDVLSDDDLAAALDGFPDCSLRMIIIDACNSGGMVGGADDLDGGDPNVLWALSAGEDEKDPGLSDFAQGLSDGLAMGENNTMKADGDGDGTVTAEEWLSYAVETYDYGRTRGSMSWQYVLDDEHTNYPIAQIPEPASVGLLGLGLLAFRLRSRGSALRRKRN